MDMNPKEVISAARSWKNLSEDQKIRALESATELRNLDKGTLETIITRGLESAETTVIQVKAIQLANVVASYLSPVQVANIATKAETTNRLAISNTWDNPYQLFLDKHIERIKAGKSHIDRAKSLVAQRRSVTPVALPA